MFILNFVVCKSFQSPIITLKLHGLMISDL